MFLLFAVTSIFKKKKHEIQFLQCWNFWSLRWSTQWGYGMVGLSLHSELSIFTLGHTAYSLFYFLWIIHFMKEIYFFFFLMQLGRIPIITLEYMKPRSITLKLCKAIINTKYFWEYFALKIRFLYKYIYFPK